MKATFFEDQLAFRAWLYKHHLKEKELLVGFYKVGSGKASMSWSESVDQALCFGWIDGIRKSIDKDCYCIRFTPRRPGSIWSNINLRKIETLTKAGLMMPEGLKAFGHYKPEKSNVYAYQKATVALAPDFEKRFKQNKAAWAFFSVQAPSYRKVMIHWIMGAKQEKTRESRLEKTIAASEKGLRL